MTTTSAAKASQMSQFVTVAIVVHGSPGARLLDRDDGDDEECGDEDRDLEGTLDPLGSLVHDA